MVDHRLALESSEAEVKDFIEEPLGDASRPWIMEHHDRAALGIELKPAAEDKPGNVSPATTMRMVVNRMHGTCHSRWSLATWLGRDIRSQSPRFVGVDLIHLRFDYLLHRIPCGDLSDVGVGIDIALPFPLPCPSVDGAKFTGLLGGRSDARQLGGYDTNKNDL